MKKYKITYTTQTGKSIGFLFAQSSPEAKAQFFNNCPEINHAFIQWQIDGNWAEKVQINR